MVQQVRQYQLLPVYLRELEKQGSQIGQAGVNFVLQCDESQRRYKGIFICPAPSNSSWRYLRPLIVTDRTFLGCGACTSAIIIVAW